MNLSIVEKALVAIFVLSLILIAIGFVLEIERLQMLGAGISVGAILLDIAVDYEKYKMKIDKNDRKSEKA